MSVGQAIRGLLIGCLVELILVSPTIDAADHGAKDIPPTLDWNTYVAQGCFLNSLIESSAQQADKVYAESGNKAEHKLQSSFKYNDLDKMGWTSHDNAWSTEEPDDQEDIFDWKVNPAIEDFMKGNKFSLEPHWEDKENGDPGDNFVIDTVNSLGDESSGGSDDEMDDGGDQNSPTHAHFKNVFNTEGLIVAWDLRSPQTIVTERKQSGAPTDKMKVPKLNKWSDVTFLEWQNIVGREGVEVNSLRGVVWPHISNRATMDVIYRAISGKRNEKCPEGDEVPGLDGYSEKEIFPRESEEGRALLASPLGKGAAFMLIQHKHDLGSLRVHGVEVWKEEDSGNPCMAVMFEGYSGGQQDTEMSGRRLAKL